MRWKNDHRLPRDDGVIQQKGKDATQSAVGVLQLFSYKSRTFLKTRSVSFHPLYTALLEYLEEQRRWHILSRMTISAYLSVSFWRKNAYKPRKGFLTAGLDVQMERFRRVKRLLALHVSKDDDLNELPQGAMSGLECTTLNGGEIHILFMLSFFYCWHCWIRRYACCEKRNKEFTTVPQLPAK